MTNEDRDIIVRINKYAEEVLKGIDPQNTRVSFQIQQLSPILKSIADEKEMSLEDMFIKYMDLQTEFAKENSDKFKEDYADLGTFDLKTGNFENSGK